MIAIEASKLRNRSIHMGFKMIAMLLHMSMMSDIAHLDGDHCGISLIEQDDIAIALFLKFS